MKDSDPLSIIFKAAGLSPHSDLNFSIDERATIIRNAVTQIGVAERYLDHLCAMVENIAFKASFRSVPAGDRTKPEEITAALGQVERGIRELASGLALLQRARLATGDGALQRLEAIESAQREILRSLADEVVFCLSGARPGPEFEASLPRVDRLGFQDPWRIALDRMISRISSIRATHCQSDFHSPPRPGDAWRRDLISDLANLYTEATGRRATSTKRGGNLPRNWRAQRGFSSFVANLWPIIDATSQPPSNLKIANDLKEAIRRGSYVLPPTKT